ncbi:MAG TPA: cytochrome D1 domain-containing protein [Geminicoccaceae bacterium]|nr:cytochrome D1 domain-containing protein [Geminicoccaceae bacterium]
MSRPRSISLLLFLLGVVLAAPPASAGDALPLYGEHCASCHGAARLGGMGPALLPENLGRLKREEAAGVIALGRPHTQMPGFGGALGEDEIAALVELIYTPLPELPVWGEAEIEASREVLVEPSALAVRPRHDADPLTLFVVVESGDHHATVLDGDRFEPLTRFATRFALHGGPKFSPDGRFVYFASRDGWITKYDLFGLETVAEVRAGINARNLAISHDGRVLAVANYLPHTLVLLDAGDLSPLQVIDVRDARGRQSSRVSAVYQAAPRESFVVALKDIPELWEVFYGEDPPETTGLVHSHEAGMVEALARRERFPIRRTELKEPLDDFFFGPDYRTLVGSARDGERAVVVHLDVRREIAELPLPGLPHLGSGISWQQGGRRVMATPHLKEAAVSVIDMKDWKVVKRIETLGPGFFMRSHEESQYAWVDVFFGPHRDAIHVIDKATLEIVETLRPEPGKTAAHVEFTRDGRYALVSIWEMDGAIVVYDATTLKEVKRLPMVKPSGKYNVWNKITLSDGTSH